MILKIISLLFFFSSILVFSQETETLDIYEKAAKNIFETIKDKTPDLKTKYAIKMIEYKHKVFFEALRKSQDKNNVETLKRLYCSHFADRIIAPLEKEGYKISFRIQHPLGKITAITVTFGLARVGEYYIEDKCQKEMTELLSQMQIQTREQRTILKPTLSQKINYSEYKNRAERTSWQNTQIDRKFYERHPEMQGRRLDPHNPNHKEYIKDWVNIAKGIDSRPNHSEPRDRAGRTSWQNTQIDRKFYERHPEMQGRRLDPHNPNHKEYIKDWVNIAKDSNKK